MQSTQTWKKWGLLFRWIFMNLLGVVIGVAFLVPIYVLLLAATGERVNAFLDQGVSVVIMGLFLGFFQWLALRLRIERIWTWIPATAIGLLIGVNALAVLASMGQSIPVSPIVLSSIIGALLGTAQWIVLRKHAGSSLWWILASAVGWMLGAGAVQALMTIGALRFNAENMLWEYLSGILFIGIAIGIYSTITGCLFVWLTRSREV